MVRFHDLRWYVIPELFAVSLEGALKKKTFPDTVDSFIPVKELFLAYRIA